MDTKKKATRVVVGLLVGMSVFSMMGCSSKASAKSSNDTSSCQEFIDENGQDNVDETDYTAFVGNYSDSSKYSASCSIEEGEQPQTVDICVSINTMDQNNDRDYETWTMTAKYDADHDRLTYDNGVYANYKDQQIMDEKDFGSGYFQMDSKSDETKFTWAGANNSKYAKCTFTHVDEHATDGNSEN